MTVRELKEILAEYPDDMTVLVPEVEGEYLTHQVLSNVEYDYYIPSEYDITLESNNRGWDYVKSHTNVLDKIATKVVVLKGGY